MSSFVRKCNEEYSFFLKLLNGQGNKVETEVRSTMSKETERKMELVYKWDGTGLKYTTVT